MRTALLLSLSCLILLFAGALPAQAQPAAQGVISGRVQNADTGAFISGARVQAADTGLVAITDDYGQFRMPGVSPGPVNLRVTYPGLLPAETSVTAVAGETVVTAVRMSASTPVDDVVELEAFVVSASEFDAFRAAINQQRFAQNIKTVVDAGAFGDVTEGNVGEFLKFLPGVNVDYVAADVRSVSVRGLRPEFTPVTVDGNRMASAASSTSSRAFEFEQVSLNNVARIEVVKVPTPSMEADSLGGSVNMVSRNAFELSGRRLNYRVYANIPGDYIRLSDTPGPGSVSQSKIRPGFDFTWSDPLSENFGYVFNYMNSQAFTPQTYLMTQWDTTRSAGPTQPFLRYFNLRDGPKLSFRESAGFKADYRVAPQAILSVGVQRNDYSTFFFNREVRWETNPSGTDYSPTHTTGNGSGRFRHQLNTREKLGRTIHADIGMKHFLDRWEVDYDAYYSKSTNEYRDTANGYFERSTFRTLGDLQVNYNAIGPDGPASVTTQRAGADIDPFVFDNSTPLESLRSSPEFATDEIYGGKFNVKRTVSLAGLPASWQTGMLHRHQERSIDRQQFTYTPTNLYTSLGPGSAAFRDDHYTGMSPGWGWGAPQWPDPYKLYQYFVANPDHFRLDEIANVRYQEENRQFIEEEVTAAYLMGTLTMLDNRLTILGGVRYEHTQTMGDGYLLDENIIYQRDASGNFVLRNPILPNNPQNRVLKPEFAGASLAEQVRAQYAGRQQARNSYWDYYPSLHGTWQISERLQMRGAYARTLGRPDIEDLAPGIRYNANDEAGDDGVARPTIIINNPELGPYTGDNFDISLEYYFDSGGVFAIGAFHKKIRGFIDVATALLTPELAARYGIEQSYVEQGWQVRRTINAGDVTIKGFEIQFVQDLHVLHRGLRGFSAFANATVLSTEGDYGAEQSQLVSSYVPGFVKETMNWGVSFDRGPIDIRLKWNRRGKQMRDTGDIRGIFADGSTVWNRFFDKRLTTDLNIEYRIHPRFRVFLNGRNIFNKATNQLRVGTDTPDYAALERRDVFGSLWSFGIKGAF
jgi:TonB-dependent receptor